MKRKLDDATELEPVPKKPKTSYEYLSNINSLQHERNKEWLPEKPDFSLLAKKYQDFASL